jgi:microsomal dipeptidase-like Zn-dependent dipeptidase
VAATAEVEVQDVFMESGGVVEGVTIKIITSFEHQKMDSSVKVEGLVVIKDDIEAVEIFEKIPLVMVMSMW